MNQFVCQKWKSIVLVVSPSKLDGETVSFDVTHLAKTKPQRFDHAGIAGSRCGSEEAYSSDLGRLVGPGTEPPGEEHRTRTGEEGGALNHWVHRSVEPPGLVQANLLSQEPRDVLPDVAPCVRGPRDAEHVPQGDGDPEPGR